MADMERVKTGIPGFDGLIEGGIPRGSFVVLTGGPGTGKTIFASQFLAGGVALGENGIFVSVEQPRDEIIAQAAQFGWDFAKMEKEGKLKIMCLGLSDLFASATLEIVENAIRDNHYSRIVIDSITSLILTPTSPQVILNLMGQKISAGSVMELRRASASVFIDRIKKLGVTTLGIAQKIEGMPGETEDTISEFKGDGLILTRLSEMGTEAPRVLKIMKMRKTGHTFEEIPFKISANKGIELLPMK
jgi:circadian clock protein KaiC